MEDWLCRTEPVCTRFDPNDPPQFESEAAYLERHGLLLPGERRRLRRASCRRSCRANTGRRRPMVDPQAEALELLRAAVEELRGIRLALERRDRLEMTNEDG